MWEAMRRHGARMQRLKNTIEILGTAGIASRIQQFHVRFLDLFVDSIVYVFFSVGSWILFESVAV
jgi:hypothetical protein